MAQKKLRLRVGLFVLATLVVLAGLIYLFNLFPNLFRTRGGTVYTIEFTDAPNLTEGTPVRRSGVKIGQVESVDLDDDTGSVIVKVRIEPRFVVRRSEEPTLTTGILSGDTSIDFRPREVPPGQQPDRTPVDPGTRLAGKLDPTVTTLINRATAVVSPAQETLTKIQRSMDRLEKAMDKVMPVVEETLKEYRDLAKETRQSLPELRKTNEEIQKLATAAREFVPDLRRTNDDIQKLTRSTNDAVKAAGDVIKASNDAVKQINDTAKGVNDTLPAVRDAIKEFTVTSRNWGQVGERVNVLIRTNEDSLNSIVKNADRAVTGIAEVFNTENRNDLANILRQTSQASRRFPSIADETDKTLKQGQQTMRDLSETLRRTNEVLDAIYRSTKPGEKGGLLYNLEEATDKFNKTMTDVRELMRAIAQSDGSLRRFIADPALYNHLDDAALMAGRLMPQIERVMKDLEVFADKLARHPELIGVGGAVRPSAGIKEPPYPTVVPRHP